MSSEQAGHLATLAASTAAGVVVKTHLVMGAAHAAAMRKAPKTPSIVQAEAVQSESTLRLSYAEKKLQELELKLASAKEVSDLADSRVTAVRADLSKKNAAMLKAVEEAKSADDALAAVRNETTVLQTND